MNKIIYILPFVLLTNFGHAQSVLRKNAIYFELLGNSNGIISVNYERLFFAGKETFTHLALRAGFCLSSKLHDSSLLYNIPVEITTLFGRTHNFLETGLGWTPSFGTSDLNNPALPPEDRGNFEYSFFFRVGYRLMKSNGFLLRVAPLGQFVHTPYSSYFQWTIGITCGMTFDTLQGLWHELDD